MHSCVSHAETAKVYLVTHIFNRIPTGSTNFQPNFHRIGNFFIEKSIRMFGSVSPENKYTGDSEHCKTSWVDLHPKKGCNYLYRKKLRWKSFTGEKFSEILPTSAEKNRRNKFGRHFRWPIIPKRRFSNELRCVYLTKYFDGNKIDELKFRQKK